MNIFSNRKVRWGLLIGAAALTLILVLLLRPAPAGTYDNLIRNGDFEQISNGLPVAWETDAYFPQQSYTTYDTDEGVTGQAAHIQNHYLNDARFAQTVSVSPNTLYCLRGFVKADAQKGLGGNLSIKDVYVFSPSVYELDEDWQELILYGRTGGSQTSVTIFARLGGYSGESTGEAWFDDITLNRVDAVPADFRETSWAPVDTGCQEEKASTGALTLTLVFAAYCALFILMCAWVKKQPAASVGKKESRRSLAALGVILLLGLLTRLFIASRVPGYDVDIGCFRGWASDMAAVGPAEFYQQAGHRDYPPGYMWILWLLGGLGQWTGGGVSEFMVKLPPILADLILCALLYAEAKKRLPERFALLLALLYAFNPLVIVTGAAWGQVDAVMLLLLFLTVLFALRGQWIGALPAYMAAVLVKPQALLFGPLGLAALILHGIQTAKANDAAKNKKTLRDVLLGLGFMLLAALVIAGPFLLHQEKPLSWLIELYRGTMSQYGYVTVNACNLYFLLGKNWLDAATPLRLSGGDFLPALIVLCIAVMPLAAAAVMRWRTWMASREGRLKMILCASLALALAVILMLLLALGQLTYARLGTLMIIYTAALFMLLLLLSGELQNLPLLGAAMLLALFHTGTMMHERYLFPAVGLLLLAYALKKDRRILYLALGVSLFGFLNVGCCLDRNIRIGGAEGHLWAPVAGIESDLFALEIASAAGSCLFGAYAVYLSVLLCEKGAAALPLSALPAAEAAGDAAQGAQPRERPPFVHRPIPAMTKKDWAVMLTATVLYAVVALTNLGSVKAPQTAFVSRQEDDAVILDLGEEKTFTMLYYPGIHWRSDWDSKEFTVQTSSDGVTWSEDYEGSVKNGSDTSYTFDCFRWKYVALPDSYGDDGEEMTGRYVRIIAQFPELTLYEVLLRDAESGETLPIQSARETVLLRDAESGELLADQSAAEPLQNDTLPFLTDEQDTLEGEPGWYNSTYFDEIYHARTAYEHLHGLPVYETTHPPLGKLLMSAAIAVFGMTPFGWRFAGALAGILMLPGMYLLGRLLIKKKWGGIAALLLMAFDLMHFTQTRIATIDSFVVLFIIWSVYCMLRWFFLDDPALPLRRTLLPLGLSGLFMGLAVASKWTGCYAGAGLAVLFFYGIFRRFRAVMDARREAEALSRGKGRKAAVALPPLWQDAGIRPLWITVLSCLIFFVAVPLLIYYASYIPYFAPEGGVTVSKVIRAAEYMLSYHATPGLGMDHSFYSPWYQWPVIAKPMWYYSGAFDPEGTASTIMAMGNPAVWWTGLIGLLGVIALAVFRHYDEKSHTLSRYPRSDDPRFALLLICFAAQYLPWVPVPRGTYIYHYFPSVPFIILCSLLCLDTWAESHEKAARIAVSALVIAAGALFIAFFPYASGVTASISWLRAMQWFPRWLWY